MRGHVLIGVQAPSPGRVATVHGAVEEWLLDRQALRNLSPNTLSWYRARFGPVADLIGQATPVDQITIEHVRRHFADLRARGCADMTVHDDYRVIRAFTNWCARQGWVMDQRLLMMEPPRVGGEGEVAIYSTAELAELGKWMRRTLRNALIHGLFLGTGVRLKELIGIQLGDRHHTQLEVRWQTAKGRKTRWPPLSATLQRDWIRYVSRERPAAPAGPESPLLLLSTGSPLSRAGVRQLLVRASKATGIHAHPHRYRHTCFTLIVRKGLERGQPVDPEWLRQIAGWSSQAMVERYVHLAKRDLLNGWEQVAPY